MSTGAKKALREIGSELAVEVNEEFRSQVMERRRVTEAERTATTQQTGLDLDSLIENFQGTVEAMPTENGVRVGVADGEELITAGRVFKLAELSRIHELGTSTIQQREHFGPVKRRFKQRRPKAVAKVRQAVLDARGDA